MERRSRVLVLALVLASAPIAARAGITVWVDKEQGGESIRIDHAVPDLRKLDRAFDDRISSLQADEPWQVCSMPRYKGDCREVSGSVINLHAEGINDRISSLRPAKKKKGESRNAEPRTRAGSGETETASIGTWWQPAPDAR